MHSIDFHAHHSPQGAYATFTCGRFGAGGGPTIEGTAPAGFDLVVGYVDEHDELWALPFFRSSGAPEITDFVTPAGSPEPKWRHALGSVTREYERGTDTWLAPNFSFTLYTPVAPLPDPESASESELMRALLPVVTARVRLDNRAGQVAKRLVFAVDAGRPCRFIEGVAHGPAVGWGREIGFAAREQAGLEAWVQWSELDFLAHHRSHLLGRACGFTLEVPAGEIGELDIVIGFCRAGSVTTGLDSRYFYTRWYSNLEQVLAAGLEHFADRVLAATQLNETLWHAALDEHQRFLLAHAERSYWGNTQLLEHEGKPLWVVLEGEYAMMNTFDLTVDQSFYELAQSPWLVRNVLDQFVARYSYTDELTRPVNGARRTGHAHTRDPHRLAEFLPEPERSGLPGGLSFTHDMGVAGQFTAPGQSSYELPGLAGCFSFMTAEQLMNWVLTALNYVTRTGDQVWLEQRAPVFRACLQSLEQRDDPEPQRRNGLVNLDSSRCAGGWEITTYDSLDPSLGQARRNLYMASKGFATWLGLLIAFERLALEDLASAARAGAERAAHSIVNAGQGELGFIPALFEAGNQSAILPAIEGLVFPLFWGRPEFVSPEGPFGALIRALEKHLHRVLQPDLCLFPDGGWKLSSTSDNSWLSKIFICQFVAERVFGVRAAPESHAAHAHWQQVGARDSAMSDQCVAGIAQGSKYYPRCVTAMLWLVPV
ncbi:MAG TPA: glycoside hydrolase family 52 protein [Polyangiaceae bacterium]